MNTIQATRPADGSATPWPERLSQLAVAALLWAALHFVIDPAVLSRGMDRPVTVLVGAGGFLAAVAVGVLLVAAAWVAEAVSRVHDGTSGLLVVGLALAGWSWTGGTMDDWLIRVNPVVGPGSARAYWPLLPEHLYWAVVLTAVLLVGTWWQGRRTDTPGGWRGRLGLGRHSAGFRDEITALLINLVVAGTLMFILTGPRIGHTYRGQVYFAVAVAFALGTIVGGKISGVRGLVWYLAGPVLLGVGGVALAAARPVLPGVYDHINVIPAWGLVRPLPIELAGVGAFAIVLSLRAAARLSSEESRD